jgi:hypothetical protein
VSDTKPRLRFKREPMETGLRAAGRDAATAAVDAKAAERWAEFICEWTLRYESEWDGFNGND